MDEVPNSNGSGSPEQPVLPAGPNPAPPSRLHEIFIGPNGIRAGWRFAIYLLIVVAIVSAVNFLMRRHHHPQGAMEDPVKTLRREWLAFATVALVAWIMSRIEKQPWGNYGMPWRNAFRSRFWQGGLFGFAALSLIMGMLHLTHCYYIDGMAIGGAQILKFGALWLGAFIGVGFFEEFIFRGYAQFTLASGMGFWPAAVLTSAIFLRAHMGNHGETWYGLADVFVFGMLACFIWWRTGDLWFAVGLHAFWDWGQSFFYSVPDSGMEAAGHLFRIRFQGPAWLSGGSAGPEGSAINLGFDLVMFFIIAWLFPKRKFVGMNDRRQAAEAVSIPLIDPSALQG
jgi:hypothetical protein